jgi:hypothetical protein
LSSYLDPLLGEKGLIMTKSQVISNKYPSKFKDEQVKLNEMAEYYMDARTRVKPRYNKVGELAISSREEDIFSVLSNPVGLKLFKLIAAASLTDTTVMITSDFLQSQTQVTRKQYYSNMSRLVNKTGLISRKRGRYVLSNYGKVVFHSLNIITRGTKYFWALKALEEDEFSAGGIPAEQILEISARLIEDKDIQKIVSEPMMMNKPKEDVLYDPLNRAGTRG